MALPVNALCYGDCLDWMQRWDDESVDLIYLDPPFNSSATYNVLYAQDSAGGAQTRAFADTWTWDAAAGERLAMYEGATGRLSPQGRSSDWRASSARPGCWPTSRTWPSGTEHMRRLLKPTGQPLLPLRRRQPRTTSRCCLDAIFGPARVSETKSRCMRTSSHNDGAQGLDGSTAALRRTTTSSCPTWMFRNSGLGIHSTSTV